MIVVIVLIGFAASMLSPWLVRTPQWLLFHQLLISSDMISSVSVSIFWTCLVMGVWTSEGFQSENASSSSTMNNRQGRLFSLFNIVTFKQGECTVVSDTTMSGTCMTSTECVSNGGAADGNCASGFGVCCSFVVRGCGGTVAHNCTYIQNTNFPATGTGGETCKFGFNRICDNLCQIRLDFVNLVMAQPPTIGPMVEGDCATSGDFLAVNSPTGKSPPVTCGTLTGQHMFLETGSTGGAGSIDITYGSATSTRTFKVKVTFYQCDSLNKAPADCVQYFTGVSGTFQSYNYQGGQLIDNQRYATCFRQEEGYCTIQYREDTTTTTPAFDFFITASTVPTAIREAKVLIRVR
eukprot:TCALIF_13282-PA protein Name:"Protein of unknown function" AED:0.22 eAED:0.30 QI:0/0.88/0.7/1/0.77/0.9/10/0/349